MLDPDWCTGHLKEWRNRKSHVTQTVVSGGQNNFSGSFKVQTKHLTYHFAYKSLKYNQSQKTVKDAVTTVRHFQI